MASEKRGQKANSYTTTKHITIFKIIMSHINLPLNLFMGNGPLEENKQFSKHSIYIFLPLNINMDFLLHLIVRIKLHKKRVVQD